MLSRIFPSLFRRRQRLTLPVPASDFLEIDQRQRLAFRDWLALPTTQLVLSIMERQHPGRNIPPTLPRSEWDERAAVCYLNRIRGWELFRNQLLELPNPPMQDAPLEETFPNPEK